MFLNCLTCFGRHTAHHQELKDCNCSLWFYICFWLPATKNICKTRSCNYCFELLMMGGVLPRICSAIKKQQNNKFYYTVASCWFFLWVLYYDAWIQEHQICLYLFLWSGFEAMYCTAPFLYQSWDRRLLGFQSFIISLFDYILLDGSRESELH